MNMHVHKNYEIKPTHSKNFKKESELRLPNLFQIQGDNSIEETKSLYGRAPMAIRPAL